MMIFLFVEPIKPAVIRRQIYWVLEGGRKFATNILAMWVTIGGDVTKNGKNTHLLVIILIRLSQKIGLIDLKNRTQFIKGNG